MAETRKKETKVENKEPKLSKKVKKKKNSFTQKQKRKLSHKKVNPGKKEKLAKKARQTRWAPVWVILKKFGAGKRVHPSTTTRHRRSWRRTKLKIKPRKLRRSHYG